MFQVAPYNTFYSHLEEHMTEVGIVPTINRWNESLALGAVDPHDSLSHPTGASDKQSESASSVDPNQFTNFLVRFPFLLVYHQDCDQIVPFSRQCLWFRSQTGLRERRLVVPRKTIHFHYQMHIWQCNRQAYVFIFFNNRSALFLSLFFLPYHYSI